MTEHNAGHAETVTVKQQEATRLLNRASDGELAAAADLLPLVYEEMRALAVRYLRNERVNHTLQPTALVHEAYMSLVDQTSIQWKSRNQFFVIAAKAMRNILVDHARGKRRLKRGRGWGQLTISTIEEALSPGHDDGVDIERLHAALEELAKFDASKAQLVELRFFAGLSEQDAADVLGMARSTASEHWRMARAWLHRAMKDDDS